VWIADREMFAHRRAYELATGVNPGAFRVLHRCDNPPCCNPAHLFLGTLADNAADMVAKNRQVRGERVIQSKLTAADVVAMRAARADGATHRELAQRFGVSVTAVSYAVRKLYWKSVP